MAKCKYCGSEIGSNDNCISCGAKRGITKIVKPCIHKTITNDNNTYSGNGKIYFSFFIFSVFVSFLVLYILKIKDILDIGYKQITLYSLGISFVLTLLIPGMLLKIFKK